MIDVKDVSKSFGPLRAVDRVSVSVEPREFLSLLGPSGCGKTTLLRLIAGFESTDSGSIQLNGEDVTHRPPYKRDVCQVFQSYALFPHMSVWDNIAFGLRMRGLSRSEIDGRVTDVLAMISLAGSEGKKPRQLSGGQQQRVALARAIVCRPKVLLLDEPLSALDAKLRHAMQLELRQLHQKLGMTFIFVTHDQSEALTMSDRVAVMNRGSIEQIGSPMDVYQRPNSPFVANFVGQSNLWTGSILRDGVGQVHIHIADDLKFAIEPNKIAAGDARAAVLVRPEKIQVFHRRERDIDFTAELVDIIFSGPTTQLRLRTASGIEIHAMTVLTVDRAALSSAKQMFCRIEPGDVHILPSSSTEAGGSP